MQILKVTTVAVGVAAAVGAVLPGTAMAANATASTPTRACAASALQLSAWQAAHPPVGTGTGAAVVQFTNVSKRACVLKGHPTTVAGVKGTRTTPLKITTTGKATTVTLRPRAKAWVKLTFVQVQGEGDGYCKSGKTPQAFPKLSIGLPRAGKHQVALNDGWWAECDNKVTATAVSSVKPA